jgi:hypothetical protein
MLKLLTFTAALLAASTAAEVQAAEPAPRVVLLDALTLPAAFEQANVHGKVRDALAAAVRRHGWEPVSITTQCHDLTCAGAVAREAKTVYVLILAGRYAATDTFATDVGVSFWRDGSVVAMRTEGDEEAELQKSGGLFLPCGPPDGACTPDLLTTKLEQYAGRLLDGENAAIKARAAAAAVTTAPVIATPVVPSIPPATVEGRGKRILGWSLLGAGALAGGGALALWAYNGSDVQCSSLPGDHCRAERHTTTAAIITGSAALAAAIGGVVLLSIDRGDGRVALSVHPSGLSVGGTF